MNSTEIKSQRREQQFHVIRWRVTEELTHEQPILIASFAFWNDAQAFAQEAANRSNREYVSGFALSFAVYHKGIVISTRLNDAAFSLYDKDIRS